MREFHAGEEWQKYYDLVSEYLSQLESHLESYGIDTDYL